MPLHIKLGILFISQQIAQQEGLYLRVILVVLVVLLVAVALTPIQKKVLYIFPLTSKI